MRLPENLLSPGTYVKPRLFLCETDKTRLCQLDVTDLNGSFKFNSMSEISFEVSRIYNVISTGETKINPFYDKIESLRLIYLEGFGYFELQAPELIGDGIKESKRCTAYSLEYTLSQKYLTDFYVNIGTVESLEVLNAESENKIVPIILYNPTNTKLSLLHLILEKVYGWKIGHVDPQLRTLSRQFEIDRQSVYDFIINEICNKFNCYAIFDTVNNTINLYAEYPTAKFIGDGITNVFAIGDKNTAPFSSIETVSINGYKTTQWSYRVENGIGMLTLDDAPENDADIEIVGVDSTWDTDVFVSFDNLSREIKVTYDADSIKTVLTVTYGDDEDIRETNLGIPYLTDISFYYNVDWMGQDLYDAYTLYLEKSNNMQADYTNNSKEILKYNDRIYYEENRLSLEYSQAIVNNETVGTYYTRHENADGSYYYSEVSLPSEYKVNTQYYSNATTNVNETKVDALYEVLKKYFYNYWNKKLQDDAGTRDELYETYITNIGNAIEELEELRDSFSFIESYTIQDLADDLQGGSKNDKANCIKRFLSYVWAELGRTPLKSLYLEKYLRVQELDVTAGWSDENSKNYGNYYPVVILIDSIKSTILQRDETIKNYENERKVFYDANNTISDSLLMDNNFTEGQLVRLSAFLREDELHIDDIITTSLDNLSSSFKIKQDAMESGRIELNKISKPQLQFSMTMANIYALKEFKPIVNQFQLGNIIKVAIRPGYIKQSRLLQVDFNFEDFSDFSCEFGELTNLRTQSDIHADLLSQAISAGKSVATNSSYWTKGADSATSTDLKIQKGLLDATTQIKAIDGTQGVVIDKYGIKLQKNNSDGSVDPHQTWMTNNMILMSDDGFETSRSALGEITVDGNIYYGLIAEMVLSGYIEGSKIVGGELYSSNYSKGKSGTYFDLDGGDFELGNGKISYDSNTNDLILKGVTISWDSTNSPEIKNIDGLSDYVEQLDEIITHMDDRFDAWYQDTDPSIAWHTDELKKSHEGDLWHYTGATITSNGIKRVQNSEWIWKNVNGTYQWISIEVSDVVFDKIDGKSTIYVTEPENPIEGDLLIPIQDSEKYKTGKVYRYYGVSWIEVYYTDDTVANEALEKAKKGISDAASGISLANAAKTAADNAQNAANQAQTAANSAQTSANNAQTAANNAATKAGDAEKNAKKYADDQDTKLSTTLTNAYQTYSDTKISEFNTEVSKYLKAGGNTVIDENYIVSPLIAGGYLDIEGVNGRRVIIDPNNLTNNNYIFQVHNGNKITLGIDSGGNASFAGTIYATGGEFSGAITGSTITGSTLTSENDKYGSIEIENGLITLISHENVNIGSISNGDGMGLAIRGTGAPVYITSEEGIYINGNKLVDFAIEDGTKKVGSVNWTYRKWNSGKVDLWAAIPVTSTSVNQAMGSWYRSANISLGDLPFEISSPNVIVNFNAAGSSALLWNMNPATSTYAGSYYLIRATSADNVSGTIYVQIHGTI